jgi:HEAT repeat protein
MLSIAYELNELKEKTINKQERRLRKGKKGARRNAALILGCIGNEESCFYLRRALKDGDARVRRNSVWALGELGDDTSGRALIDALGDSDEKVQSYAAFTLGKLKYNDAIDSIIELSENDEKTEAQANAICALTFFNDERATRAIVNALRFEYLHDFIEWIILNRKLRKKADFLIQELKTNMHAQVRRKIATILGKLKLKKAVMPLIQALDDEDVYVRLESVKALAEFKDNRAVQGLAKRLTDDISDVRRAAKKALTIITNEEEQV